MPVSPLSSGLNPCDSLRGARRAKRRHQAEKSSGMGRTSAAGASLRDRGGAGGGTQGGAKASEHLALDRSPRSDRYPGMGAGRVLWGREHRGDRGEARRSPADSISNATRCHRSRAVALPTRSWRADRRERNCERSDWSTGPRPFIDANHPRRWPHSGRNGGFVSIPRRYDRRICS